MPYGPETGQASQVVSSQIDEHVVFRKFLGIGQKTAFQRQILLLGLSAGPCSGEREGMQNAVYQFYQSLWGRACKLQTVAGNIKHVRGGIAGSQKAIGIEKASITLTSFMW